MERRRETFHPAGLSRQRMEGLRSLLVQHRGFLQMMLVLGVGGNLPVGYQISVIGYPSGYIKRFINETWVERSGSPPREETLLFLWSLIVSIYGIGGLGGSLGSGYLTLRYGKKRCLLGTDLLVVFTAFLVGFSKRAESFEMILVGRFLFGVSAGLCMAIHPQYAGEVSPKKLRGFANATSGFFWSLGKSLGQILGLREFLGTENSWPLLLAFIAVTASVQLLTLPFFPESPPYLLIQKGDEQSCLRALQQLWGPGAHEEEMADLKKEAAASKTGQALTPWRLLKDPTLRPQMQVLVAAILTLQLCGINAVYFYTFEVFRAVGFREALIPYLSLGVGLCELASAVLCTLTIERFGRRTLLWGGCGAMAIALSLLTLTLSLQNKHHWTSYCSVTLIFLFVIFFGLGPNGATMCVMMEIFTQPARPAAFVIGGWLNWAGLFLIGISFPFAVGALGPFCFLIFAAVLVGSGIFFYLFLPETKGKSVAEITEEFKAVPTPARPPLGRKLAAVFRKGFREDPSIYSNF